MKIWKYEKFVNTSLSRDQAHFNLKLFHRNKTTQSSASYCWIFTFIPCYTSIIPSVLGEFRLVACLENLPIVIPLLLIVLLNLQIQDTEKNTFPRLKCYIKLLHHKTIFLEGAFYLVKKMKRFPLPSAPIEMFFATDISHNKQYENVTLKLYLYFITRPSCIYLFATCINVCNY